MNRYTAPVRDMKFALYDVIEADKLYASLGIEHAQRDLLDAVMDEAAKFTQTVLAPLNGVGDEVGCSYDKATGAVTTPPGLLIYMLMSLVGFSASRNRSCAEISVAMPSWTGPDRKMIRSVSRREKMS